MNRCAKKRMKTLVERAPRVGSQRLPEAAETLKTRKNTFENEHRREPPEAPSNVPKLTKRSTYVKTRVRRAPQTPPDAPEYAKCVRTLVSDSPKVALTRWKHVKTRINSTLEIRRAARTRKNTCF